MGRHRVVDRLILEVMQEHKGQAFRHIELQRLLHEKGEAISYTAIGSNLLFLYERGRVGFVNNKWFLLADATSEIIEEIKEMLTRVSQIADPEARQKIFAEISKMFRYHKEGGDANAPETDTTQRHQQPKEGDI